MSDLDQAISDLVVANRILANEDVVDAYGHVSVRYRLPQHYHDLGPGHVPTIE